jgi:hypothetical protein
MAVSESWWFDISTATRTMEKAADDWSCTLQAAVKSAPDPSLSNRVL